MAVFQSTFFLIALSFGLVIFIFHMPENVNGQPKPKDICKSVGHFKSQDCYGYYFRCIFNKGINRFLLFRKQCRLIGGIQSIYDEGQKQCVMAPPTTPTTTTTTTTTTTVKPTGTANPTATTVAPVPTTTTTTAATTVAPVFCKSKGVHPLFDYE